METRLPKKRTKIITININVNLYFLNLRILMEDSNLFLSKESYFIKIRNEEISHRLFII